MFKPLITPDAYADLVLAIDSCPVEISGCGAVRIEGDALVIHEIVIWKQTCHMAGTHSDDEAYGRYFMQLRAQGREQELSDKLLWWHSHVYGSAYLSGTDLGTIEKEGRYTPADDPNPWLLSIVGNKFKEFYVQLDVFHPKRLVYKDLPLRFTQEPSRDDIRSLMRKRYGDIYTAVRKNVEIGFPSIKRRGDAPEERA